jgi:hypothetical protein
LFFAGFTDVSLTAVDDSLADEASGFGAVGRGAIRYEIKIELDGIGARIPVNGLVKNDCGASIQHAGDSGNGSGGMYFFTVHKKVSRSQAD